MAPSKSETDHDHSIGDGLDRQVYATDEALVVQSRHTDTHYEFALSELVCEDCTTFPPRITYEREHAPDDPENPVDVGVMVMVLGTECPVCGHDAVHIAY